MASSLSGLLAELKSFEQRHATGVAVASGITGLGLGAAGGALLAKSSSRKKSGKRKARSSKSSRSRSPVRRRKRTRRTPHTAGKRKDRSRKRIRYTKNGQPYVLLASGKARFISKRGAKMSRKRKGGRY